ncbi:hypothetical protein [Xenorhabdus bovienii]|uniref:hypothetical protein n=1 Tax=Xenorhabdus bovienii TaxID=40576 RepID=UPI0023B3164A|nr:hypothetical protein [Xenorhabdus bovienii]MDE9527773.1 hypothetical protein [Xenorhabdus bovienii]
MTNEFENGRRQVARECLKELKQHKKEQPSKPQQYSPNTYPDLKPLWRHIKRANSCL